MNINLGEIINYRTKNGNINIFGTVIGISGKHILLESLEEFPNNSTIFSSGSVWLNFRKTSVFKNTGKYLSNCFEQSPSSNHVIVSRRQSSWINKNSKCIYKTLPYSSTQTGDTDDDI